MAGPTDRRAVQHLESPPRGQVLRDSTVVREKLAKGHPDKSWGLGVAKVTEVNYEEYQVSLRIMSGASDDFVRLPVPITFPGAGTRHFFGAMPRIGDHCIVGWIPQESSKGDGTRIPVILSWLLPGVWPGREWATTAGFPPDEFDLGIEKNAQLVEGVHDRIRRKLRHIQPGNIVASSSQGSDLVLDEGVTLANRRGNEIRLRDQDQALVIRSLQQFHAMAGARIYSGMVQRDALFLATSMVSDKQVWDGGLQSSGGDPIASDQLPEDGSVPKGFLTPARVLAKLPNFNREGAGNAGTSRALVPLDPHLDPYTFLQRGGFIDADGLVVDHRRINAIYGGKPIFRVAAQSKTNAVLEPDKPTLTEYRIEVAHTSDGRLPVTEQTDMFDAERLPPWNPSAGGEHPLPPNAPFIEWVMGSVVGNDPFSNIGRGQYGVPLVMTVFDQNTPAPRLGPAKLVSGNGSGESPTPIEEHAATLFRLSPPMTASTAETLVSYNKKGQLKAAIGGPPNEFSVEAALRGGMKLSVGGVLELLLNEGIQLGSTNGSPDQNIGLNLHSDKGAVCIFGGGSVKSNEAVVQRAGRDGQEANTPSVLIEAGTNARLRAVKKVEIKGAEAEINASSVDVRGHQVIRLSSAESIQMSTNDFKAAYAGKRTDTFSGPKGGLPTNGALHEQVYAPIVPGLTAIETTIESGDRIETFKLGNHETTVNVGDITYTAQTGTFTAQAGQNTLKVKTDALEGSVAAGSITLDAKSGSSTLSGFARATVKSEGGEVIVSGALGVRLRAPILPPNSGSILVSGSLDPMTGLPFSTWGLGAPFHTVESA